MPRLFQPGDDDRKTQRFEPRLQQPQIVRQRRQGLVLLPGNLLEQGYDIRSHRHDGLHRIDWPGCAHCIKKPPTAAGKLHRKRPALRNLQSVAAHGRRELFLSYEPHMIERLLPPQAACDCAARRRSRRAVCCPRRRRCSDAPADERRREFSAGRHCARQALRPVSGRGRRRSCAGRGESRCGRLEIVGSITHCRGYRAAAVARTADLVTIGIDAEPHAASRSGVADYVLSEAERARAKASAGGRALGSADLQRQGRPSTRRGSRSPANGSASTTR